MPPPRNTTSVAASRNSPARISNIKKEPAVQDVPSNLDPEAAPGDFYAKILAKVRPQKPETVPPAKAELKSSSTGRNTLPPPNWGAVSNQSENYAQAHPPSRVPASTQSVTASPIRVLGSSPAQSFGSAASSTSAAGEVDIPVNVEADFADNSIEQPGGPGASQAAAPAAFRRASPAPPKRPDPVIPVDIQLPPMDGNAETRLPSGLSVVISPSTPPPASESKAETKSETKPEATSKPSTEIVTDNTSPGLRAYRKGGQPRFAGAAIAIITVGLLGVGGGVAATVYALKSSTKNANPTAPSASVAANQPNNSLPQASATPPPQRHPRQVGDLSMPMSSHARDPARPMPRR